MSANLPPFLSPPPFSHLHLRHHLSPAPNGRSLQAIDAAAHAAFSHSGPHIRKVVLHACAETVGLDGLGFSTKRNCWPSPIPSAALMPPYERELGKRVLDRSNFTRKTHCGGRARSIDSDHARHSLVFSQNGDMGNDADCWIISENICHENSIFRARCRRQRAERYCSVGHRAVEFLRTYEAERIRQIDCCSNKRQDGTVQTKRLCRAAGV